MSELKFCTQHGCSYLHECSYCYSENKAEWSGTVGGNSKEKLNSSHPLKNPDSKHYQMIDGVEAIERLEQMYSKEELAIWAKITAMKYRLRITNKDAVEKEATKIRGFEAYYKYLEQL